jgi:mannose-6-phosphate isomerase-like protein (cupin superfamily)
MARGFFFDFPVHVLARVLESETLVVSEREIAALDVTEIVKMTLIFLKIEVKTRIAIDRLTESKRQQCQGSFMLITRWQAPLTPSIEQLKILLENEGLDPFIEENSAGEKIPEHRHPFNEVRIVAKGEMLFNIAGNQILLRTGDRLEVPSNTKHWHQAHGTESCICICANRVF